MEKDNGYVEKLSAEATALADTGEGRERDCPREASTAMGKFKDVDALLKAYESLQAEFTRRSQRLKQLERETENSKRAEEGVTAAEKLRKNAERVKMEEEKFDGFITDLERANVRAHTRENSVSEEPVALAAEAAVANVESEGKGEEETRRDGKDAFVAIERKERQVSSAEELYRLANENEEVRLKIIGEYLHSVGKAGAPLTRSGNGVLSAPPIKAKTVREAGEMALRWLQREGTQG